MSWTTGERADAHHLVGVLREKFARDEKRSSREFVADYFRSAGADSVLDLWGGGQSARALRDALPEARIVSVENGSVCDTDWFRDRNGRRVSKERLRRAHAIDCDEAGVEALWGDASAAVAGMSAVWLDFCSQWHPKMAKLIDLAGPHVDHLAVTVQPDRDGFGSLGLHDRLLAVASVIAGHADMVPAYVGSYQRNDLGQDMALFVMDRRSTSGDGREAAIVLPRHILSGLATRGFWTSRRFAGRGAMFLGKCSVCDASFTYRPPAGVSGTTRRRLCDKHSSDTHSRTTRACDHCDATFTTNRPNQRFCRGACGRAFAKRGPRPPRTPGCHPDRPHHGHGLCSVCYEAERYRAKHNPFADCATCGTTFRRVAFGQKKYCAESCRPKRLAEYQPKSCLGCGGRQRHASQLCGPCRGESVADRRCRVCASPLNGTRARSYCPAHAPRVDPDWSASRECDVCGTPFTPSSSNQRRCKAECRVAGYRAALRRANARWRQAHRGTAAA